MLKHIFLILFCYIYIYIKNKWIFKDRLTKLWWSNMLLLLLLCNFWINKLILNMIWQLHHNSFLTFYIYLFTLIQLLIFLFIILFIQNTIFYLGYLLGRLVLQILLLISRRTTCLGYLIIITNCYSTMILGVYSAAFFTWKFFYSIMFLCYFSIFI